MCKVRLMTVALFVALLAGCGYADKPVAKTTRPAFPLNGDAAILQSWQGDFPVARLESLPADQREQGIGYIGDRDAFESVWRALKPDAPVPDIDFLNHLVLFVRNTQFYNRVSIGKIMVKEGVAKVLAMETMSAMPIEDKVAMSLAVISREGITGLRTGTTVLPIK